MTLPELIGMVHLGPLPGAPRFESLERVEAAAVADAVMLQDAGFDGLMIENFGDAPFYADDVPDVTVAAMTRVVTAIRQAVDLPVGINVLRNDSSAALAIAAVTGAQLIRVNVLSGTMFTDQGVITGRAAELARQRQALAPHVAVFADCYVKHATPPAGLTFAEALADLWERAGADAVVVSGTGTGKAPDEAMVREARAELGPHAPIYLGSGVNADNAAALLADASGAIIGSSVKAANGEVDSAIAREVVAAARQALS